jgi:hypothetical protein
MQLFKAILLLVISIIFIGCNNSTVNVEDGFEETSNDFSVKKYIKKSFEEEEVLEISVFKSDNNLNFYSEPDSSNILLTSDRRLNVDENSLFLNLDVYNKALITYLLDKTSNEKIKILYENQVAYEWTNGEKNIFVEINRRTEFSLRYSLTFRFNNIKESLYIAEKKGNVWYID